MKLSSAFGLAVIVLPIHANAEQWDIPWFVQHSDARVQALRLCHNDYRLARTPTCENAEAAADRVWGGRPTGNNPLTSMRWWVENPISRRAVLAQCARRAPGDEFQYRWCAIAGRADALAAK